MSAHVCVSTRGERALCILPLIISLDYLNSILSIWLPIWHHEFTTALRFLTAPSYWGSNLLFFSVTWTSQVGCVHRGPLILVIQLLRQLMWGDSTSLIKWLFFLFLILFILWVLTSCVAASNVRVPVEARAPLAYLTSRGWLKLQLQRSHLLYRLSEAILILLDSWDIRQRRALIGLSCIIEGVLLLWWLDLTQLSLSPWPLRLDSRYLSCASPHSLVYLIAPVLETFLFSLQLAWLLSYVLPATVGLAFPILTFLLKMGSTVLKAIFNLQVADHSQITGAVLQLLDYVAEDVTSRGWYDCLVVLTASLTVVRLLTGHFLLDTWDFLRG